MKKKYYLVAILLMLVGFAAVSTTLYLNGSTNIISNKADFKVYYSDAYVNGEQDLSVITDDTHISFTTELDTLGETYVLEYEVTNGSKNYDAELEMVCTSGNEYLSVTNEFDDENILESLDTRNGILTLELVKSYTGDDFEVSIECTLNANAQERDSLVVQDIVSIYFGEPYSYTEEGDMDDDGILDYLKLSYIFYEDGSVEVSQVIDFSTYEDESYTEKTPINTVYYKGLNIYISEDDSVIGVLSADGKEINIEGATYALDGNGSSVSNTKEVTWQLKTWNGFTEIHGIHVWTDGTNIYYSNWNKQYILNGDTWESKTWDGLSNFYGSHVWTDGTNIYYSYGSDQYVLNGDTWEPKIWDGLSEFAGTSVWTDGTNIYCSFSADHYILYDNQWVPKKWYFSYADVGGFYGSQIWTDGINIYHSYYDIQQNVLNGDTWETKTWDNLSDFTGAQIWTDGTNIYYSLGSDQYVLNGDTWETKTWDNLSDFNGAQIWTDGTNIYYSLGSDQYILEECPVN